MKKYSKLLVDYIKEHHDQLRYCGENYDMCGFEHVFKMPCPKKFLGIFSINYRFKIYSHPEDEIVKKNYVVDIDTIFHHSIRINYNTDRELIDFLLKKFKQAYKKYIENENKKYWKELI